MRHLFTENTARRFVILSCVVALTSCAPSNTSKDAGRTIDESCGFDCEAQEALQLKKGLCFEYSDNATSAATPPKLSIEVLEAKTIETNVKVMTLAYRRGGQTLMNDFVRIEAGTWRLVRRDFSPTPSYTYRDDMQNLVGVPWLSFQPQATDSIDFTASVLKNGQDATSTTYRVAFSDATPTQLKVPLGTFDAGVSLLYSENPAHGADTRRIFVANIGFIQIFSALSPNAAQGASYFLQNVRDVSVMAANPCNGI